jgi:hypothetical protein
MSDHQAQLDRIEQLLREGNALRSQAIATQQESLALQKSLIDEQRATLAKAALVNDGALAVQQRARKMLSVVIPIIVVLVVYVSYLLFLRPYV